MALYEHVFIARQDVSQQQVDNLVEQFKNVISENGGSVAKTEYWGLRSLTYRVRKNRKGHYTLLNIDAPHEAVQELERQQRLNEDVLRSLTLRVDELAEGPSAMLQSKTRCGDRHCRDGRRGDRDRGDRGHRGDRGGRGHRGERSERGPRRFEN